jgi:lipoprotein NlpI
LRIKPSDPEALNMIGRYAVSAGDTTTFNKVLQRLSALPDVAEVHGPDMLLASGKLEAASDAYFPIEEKVTNNPALSLKIGRLAVLRHSASMAELELKKLQQTDPTYGFHVLKAYIAAQAQEHSDEQTELAAAFTASHPGDDYWTCAAEIAAIGGDTAGVIAALEHAADRKEPTASYIMSNPLLAFLKNDERFLAVRQKLQAQQSEVRTALASLSL